MNAAPTAALQPAEGRAFESRPWQLPPSETHEPWHEGAHTCSVGSGGALLILSPPRTHLWTNLPSNLGVVQAVMGGKLPEATIDECNDCARRTLTRGEIGILHSNAAAWAKALEAGWEFALVLEDDANLGDEAPGGCSLPMLLSRLGALVDAATAHEPDWQLIVLSPVNTPYDFFKGTPDFCIPEILKPGSNAIRKPAFLPSPTPRGPVQLPPCWQQCPPTYHAFAWIYRAPLMAQLLDGFRRRQPPLEPLDIWVWELMAQQKVLSKAVCVEKPLVDWRPRQLQSIKDQQDDSGFLARVYRERGYGQNQ